MRKSRSDAKWNELPIAQQEQLENWLFDEHLSYDEALAKAKSELGFAGSRASVQRFYQFKAQERLLKDLADADAEAEAVERSAADTNRLRRSGMKTLAQRFFRQVRDEGISDVPLMAKLLLQSEANEIQQSQRDIQWAGFKLRRQRFELQRERWQYDVMQRTRQLLPELLEEETRQAEASDPYFENKRTNKLRRTLFGDPIPEPLPESAEEEAAMQAEAERAKAHHQELMKLPYAERRARMEDEQMEKLCAVERAAIARYQAQKAAEAAKLNPAKAEEAGPDSAGNIG